MADLKLLETLCTARGISGNEDQVHDLILKEITPYADTIEINPLGSIIAFKKGKNRAKTKLMLNAHMDEVGLIITAVTKEGLLKFATVGGIDRRVLCGKSVTIHGNLPGVIGAKPIHMLKEEEREKSVPIEDLYIDIGAKDKEEALKYVIPGDIVCFDSIFDTANGMIKSRALDDRAGCAILIDILKNDLPYDMTFVFAVQEEIGMRGAHTAAYAVNPQAAIVVESTTAADIPGVEEEKQVCHVGSGPVLSFMDKGAIYDKDYYNTAFDAAQAIGVPCQVKEAVAGGNDSGAIHVTRGGVRTIAVSLACRYLHSPVGLISQDDFHASEKLVAELANRIAGMEP